MGITEHKLKERRKQNDTKLKRQRLVCCPHTQAQEIGLVGGGEGESGNNGLQRK